MSADPKSYNFPAGALLNPAQLDHLGRALLSLTREVCVLTDRLCVLEHILADKGIDVTETISRHQPDATLQARIDDATGKIVQGVLGALQGD
jgi:hypothetical protein